jgi:hypothetical protein
MDRNQVTPEVVQNIQKGHPSVWVHQNLEKLLSKGTGEERINVV